MNNISATKWVQMTITGLLGAYLFVVAFTNITDYEVNHTFVQQVAGMEDSFSLRNRWRSVTHPYLIHAMYLFIIALEALAAACCLLGWRQMWRQRHAGPAAFNKAKRLAVGGILIGLAIWIGVFLVVGGEWFLMWQSKQWNAQGTAFHLAEIFGIALILLLKNNAEPENYS